MELISIIATLPIAGGLTFGTPTIVEEPINTNTKIEFVVEKNIQLNNGFVESKNNIPYNSESYKPVKGEEEIKREEKLSKWEEKQAHLKSNLPKEKFTGNFSAYTAAADECGKSDGITASGLKVKGKRTLACPPQYPFGTKVKIEGYGTYVCEDRGGAIKSNHFDIYMETKSQAFAFGRRHLEAEVVD
ncbi:MAG: 3D domain-containing protein [Candidatus Moranbacteria bacterium]|nr:3D domain-containing protein [Candidatus Moranbacteria bacterium]